MTKEDQEIKSRNQRTLLKSVAHEEVVSYRSTFVSYWALPILLVAIGFLCVLGWLVRIPEKVMIEGNFSYNKSQSYYEIDLMDYDLRLDQIDFDKKPRIHLVSLDSTSLNIIDGEFQEPNKVTISKSISANLNFPLDQEFSGSVELIVLKNRFILMLFEDLLTNLKIKQPKPDQ